MEETTVQCAAADGVDGFFLAKASRVGGPVTCVAFSPSSPSEKIDDWSHQPSYFFVAQGPYLIRYSNKGSNDHGADSDETNKDQQLLVFPEDESRPRGGGTIHGINFLNKEKQNVTSWDAVVYGGKRLAFGNLLGGNIGRWNVMESMQETTEKVTTTTELEGKSPSQKVSPFMEMDDWIWNVKTFPKGAKQNCDGNTNRDEMTMVVGYARHMIEVWNLEATSSGTEGIYISATRMHRLFLSPATVVTSMDFIFPNGPYESGGTTSTKWDCNHHNTLWIAAGTSFHKIWISNIPMNDVLNPESKREKLQQHLDGISDSKTGKHHLLQGHSGVVHSVMWFQDGEKISLASTSDDRSVRKWAWDETRGQWFEKWVGWGHSARVWSVSMVNSNVVSPSDTTPLLISVAEDGTARVWSAGSGETLASIHHSTSLWTVDTKNTIYGGVFLIGGTDGIASLYSVRNHISGGKMLSIDDVTVPDDRTPQTINLPQVTKKSADGDDSQQIKKKKKAKKKIQSQVIVGMKCWRDGSTDGTPRVIVATRQGSLMSFGIKEREWKTCNAWWEQSIEEKSGIRASDGNCMAVHDGIFDVAIGTSLGNIIVTSLQRGREKRGAIILNARVLRAVQGLTFLDSSCLVSFHVQSVALWKTKFDYVPATMTVEPTCVLKVETKGIPQSCAYDQLNQRFVVGDSRGNLVYFRMQGFENSKGGEQSHVEPTCVVHRVHQKQHVTSLKWLNQNTILSAGNDGCVHVSYLHGDSLQRGWSYPAPSLTGVTRIISSLLPTVVAGYHGNSYRVLDIESGYEYIRSDTGGRQRILDCSSNIDQSNHEVTPFEFQLVVCKAQKDGSNHLSVQHSQMQFMPSKLMERTHVSKGVKLHGETIFDSKFFTLRNQEIVFLVTASEDCSARISAWKAGRILDSVQLTPQESCCRCVCVTQIDEESALLVVGGGKLAVQFFLIKERGDCTKFVSTRDLEITFIGNGSASKKGATIDHRINSVNAVPLLNNEDRSHFVLAGDSEGSSHAFLISEYNHSSNNNPRGLVVPTTNERPVLCIETIVIGDRILIVMGNTGGDIYLFDLPASSSQLKDSWDSLSSLWNPIGSYHGHQMGTNAISAEMLSIETTNGKIRAVVSIVSGGDDQALSTSRVTLTYIDDFDTRLQLEKEPELKVITEASFSAVKGVSHVRFAGKKYLLSVGYSQQLSIWVFCNDDDMVLQCTSRLPVDLGDVNCLSVYRSSNESTYFVAVCGMGIEMFQRGM